MRFEHVWKSFNRVGSAPGCPRRGGLTGLSVGPCLPRAVLTEHPTKGEGTHVPS
jgi:hypothetical protein